MSTSSVFAIFPNDTLFFRDGTPFNQDDAGLAEARSVFPPYPPVVAGALRAGMARTLGWPGWGNWQGNSSIVGRLGSGQNMCCLQFNGPFLARVSDEQQFQEVLFPAPTALIAQRRRTNTGVFQNLKRLQPNKAATLISDLGDDQDVWLPADTSNDPNEALARSKALDGAWITPLFLQKFLQPDFEEEWEASDHRATTIPSIYENVSATELRVGLGRERNSAKAKEGQLYQAGRQRLGPSYALVMEVCDRDTPIEPLSPMPLGGDGRAAVVQAIASDQWQQSFSITQQPAFVSDDGHIYYTIVLLTPAIPCSKTLFEPFSALPGKALFIAHSRPIPIGGWMIDHGPQQTDFAMPAGSTLFCRVSLNEMSPDAFAESIDGLWAKRLGRRTEYGFGSFAHGAWRPTDPDKRGNT